MFIVTYAEIVMANGKTCFNMFMTVLLKQQAKPP